VCGSDVRDSCPMGTKCASAPNGQLCMPEGGDCACNASVLGLEIGCLLLSGTTECAGVQVCTESGFGACGPALKEACNHADDDCDGKVDEDFTDSAGRYVHPLNCGACASPCAPPWPHMVATCQPNGAS